MVIPHFREHDVVKVIGLDTPDRSFEGTEGVSRAPQVGDTAAVCLGYDPSDPAAPLIVEMVDDQGMTVWLADFNPSELQLLTRPE